MPAPASPEMADLTNGMALTHIHDDNGNNLGLVRSDLSTGGETEDKDSGFSSEGAAEYDLADHIDQLTLLSERDVDCRVLEEFGGAGDKRARAQSQEGEEEEQEVPSKRTSHLSPTTEIRPPPEIASFRRYHANEREVGARRQNGGQRPLASSSSNATNCLGNVFVQGNMSYQRASAVPKAQIVQLNALSNQGNIQFSQRNGTPNQGNGASEHVTLVSLAGSIGTQPASLIRPAAACLSGTSGRLPSSSDDVNTWTQHSPTSHTSVQGFGSERSPGCPTTPPTWPSPSCRTLEHQSSSGSPDGRTHVPSPNSSSGSHPSKGTDLPSDVGTDGTSTSVVEKNRKIEQIVQHLIDSFPMEGGALPGNSLPLAGPPFVSRQGPAGWTGPPVAAKSPACWPGQPGPTPTRWAGPPENGNNPVAKASSTPTGRQVGEFNSLHRTAAGASEPSPAQPDIYASPPPASNLARSPPSKCIGPPLIHSTTPSAQPHLSLSVGSPETVQRSGSANWTRDGPARGRGNGPAGVQTMKGGSPSDRSALPSNVMRDSATVFTPAPMKQHASVSGPSRSSSMTMTSSTGPRCPQRQDSSSSSGSTSSTRGARSSTSGQTMHTCLSSKAGCGAMVICSDMSPPHPPSPFSPSSSSSRSSLPASSPMPESPLSPQFPVSVGSHPPAASRCRSSSAQSHVSQEVYSFPPTPDSDSQSSKSDCHSPRGKTVHDCHTLVKHDLCHNSLTGEQGLFPGRVTSLVIGYGGLPTPPHVVGPADSVSQPPHQVPPSPTHYAASAVPLGGGMEERNEVKEEEGVDYEEEVREEVLDEVCDEHGVWVVDPDSDNDNFLHSLSGMRNERVAVEYLHRLRHKPGFQQAINSYNGSKETPLYNAVCLGKLALVASMLQVGANVNIQCHYGDQAHTALHRAVERGENVMVDILLRADHTDLNARRGSDNCTALMAALMRHVPGHPRHDRLCIINRIVEEEDRLDWEARDPRSGKTVLMMGVETKDVRVFDTLLNDLQLDRARQLINMQNRAGNSAVHLAAGLHDVAVGVKEHMLRRLIQLGGDTNRRNNEGDTPRLWAPHVIDRVARLR